MAANITEYPIVPAYAGSHMETVIRPMCWGLVRPTQEEGAAEILALLKRENLPLHLIVGKDSEMLMSMEKKDLEASLEFYNK